MKLIVLIVVSIAVFMANCREPPVSRELDNDDGNFSDGRNLPDDHNLSDGRDLTNSPDLFDGDDLPYGSDLPDGPNKETSTIEPESFTGDPIYPVSATDVTESVPIMEFGPGTVQGGLENYVSSLIDRKLKEEGIVQNERKLQGGSKCKSDIVCSLLGGSCVSNSTYCSGREVPSVCSGAKCKCCITVNLEVKMHDLEIKLRSMVVNLTSANSNLNSKFDSMMNFIISSNSSQATVNSNMDLKMDSIISTNSNITIANSNMDLKVDSIMSNLTIANSNLGLKIDTIMSTNSNLTIANSDMKNDLEFIKDNLTYANANQDLKLDRIIERLGCPAGSMYITHSNQCFRVLNDTLRTWDNGKAACRALGLELAIPNEPLLLQTYLVKTYGLNTNIGCWLDGRGDGSNIRWQRNGQGIISSSSPLWYSNSGPGREVTTNHYLALLAGPSWEGHSSKLAYYSGWTSSVTRWTLCELVTK